MNSSQKLFPKNVKGQPDWCSWLKKLTPCYLIFGLLSGATTLRAEQFERITNSAVVTDEGASLGAAWVDLDGDGDLDLYVCNSFDQSNFLYLNEGNGTFSKITTGALATQGNATGVNALDYDNDGDADLYVVRFGQSNLLFENLGSGQFALNTTSPLVQNAANSFTIAAADYDNNRFLDLIVANESSQDEILYQNTATNGFVRVLDSGASGDGGFSRGASWADYDRDGDLDLFVTNDGGGDFLYKNNGNGTFSRVIQGDPVTGSNRSYGNAWGDYDNDGDLDLLVARFQQPQLLYRNDGDGVLTKINDGVISETVGAGQDCDWIDYDNDGYLDAYIVCQNSANILFHNERNGTFSRITNSVLVNNTATSTVASWADFDYDGFLDVFVSNYGQNNALFHNLGNTNNWLAIKCIGMVSNRDAVGAKIFVTAQINGQIVTQIREIKGGGGYQGQDTTIAHFGLGDATNVISLSVVWPSGVEEEQPPIVVNQYVTLVENETEEAPFVFIPGGPLFTNSIEVSIINRIPPSTIHYTLDGSEPTISSPVYGSAIELETTATIKARAFFNGFPVSEVITGNFQRVYALADGVPNTWREEYFGPGYLTDPRVPANADPDGDGYTNLQEYQGGTHPLDNDSIPIYSQIRAVPLVSWNSQTNKTYRISRRDSLQSTNWVQVGPLVNATETNSMIIDLEAGPVSFYRIELVP